MAALRAPLQPFVRERDVARLAARVRGRVIRPADADYDAARQVHNATYDRHPSLVVRAADASDVTRTVAFAAERDLRLAVRGGGHSLAGHGTVDDGVVLDLGDMRAIHLDPERREAWAQGGVRAGDYALAAGAHGLATPHGDAQTVGIGGLTLGGGIGWLVRKHGLTIDNVLSAEVVTADGRVLTASENENRDLFWAIRGGGGNFGVVTRFHYRLVDVPQILGGALVLPPEVDVVRGLVDRAAAAPEELTTISMLMKAPPAPFIPAHAQGRLAFLSGIVYAGDPAAGRAVVAPLRDLASPIADALGPMPYHGIYALTADSAQRAPEVTRSLYLSELDDRDAALLLEAMEDPSSPMAMAQIRVLGGAMSRVDRHATAFAHRTAPIMLTLIVPFADPAEAPRHVAWAEDVIRRLRPKALGVYANFLADEGESRIREAYPTATYERLAKLKRRWDPANVFRLNQNIPPAGSAA